MAVGMTCDPCCGDPGSCCGGSGSASDPGCGATQSGIPGFTKECNPMNGTADCTADPTLIGMCVVFPCAFCVNQYDFSDPDNDGDSGECPDSDCEPAAWYIVTSVDDCIECPNPVGPVENFCSVTGTFNCCYNGISSTCGECCSGISGQAAGTNPGCTDPTTFLYGPVYYGDCSTFVPADYAFLIGTCSAVACPSCPSGFSFYIVTAVVGCDDTTLPGYVFVILSGTFSCCQG